MRDKGFVDESKEAGGPSATPIVAQVSFETGQLVDLAEQADYQFPHPVQRLVVPIVCRMGSVVEPLGSGFFIGPHLLMTARHVIEDHLTGVMAGTSALGAVYVSDQSNPGHEGPWGGVVNVRHVSISRTPAGHDLALLTTDFPYIGDRAASPNALPLTFERPSGGASILVLGYSDMVGGEATTDETGMISIPHTQTVRAAQGTIEEVFDPQRDSAMLTFPVLQGDYPSPHGMSGGPVIREDGLVVGVVCSSFDAEGERPTSFASLLPNALALEADPSLGQPPNLRTLYTLLEDEVIQGDGTHRLYPPPPQEDQRGG